MIILVDYQLPSTFTFLSGLKTYSEVLDYNEKYSYSFDLITSEEKNLKDIAKNNPGNIYLNAKYFTSSEKLKELISRYKYGVINFSILDNDETILSCFSSTKAFSLEYQNKNLKIFELIDFNYLNEFYDTIRSRSKNMVKIVDNTVIKSSYDKNKIKNEYDFLKSFSNKYIYYCPVKNLHICSEIASYEMPILQPGDISSFYIDNNTNFFKETCFDQFCIKYFNDAYNVSSNNVKWTVDKLKDRLSSRSSDFMNKISEQSKTSPFLCDLIEKDYNKLLEIFEYLFKNKYYNFIESSKLCKIHGDFCLSNILYSESDKSFFLIDPRGDSELPIIYDMAKLSHSLLGGYDFILKSEYSIDLSQYDLHVNIKHTNKYYHSMFENVINSLGYHTFQEVRLFEAFLFATMLPFHTDDLHRCLAFILNSRDIIKSILPKENDV